MMLAEIRHITIPGISAKWAIGSIALFHTAVASLAIGFAFAVTVLQIVGYRRKERGYDLLAKRVQLWHVCIYNIGTINAIGLVFLLSGLYPQFWSQIFTNLFWSMILEEVCFFLLATTLTLHYFFWDRMWGHKKLHIALGALLTPLFILQFYYINGMGAFMLTPGVTDSSLSQWSGTAGFTGWSKTVFYNPSFLMLTFHRALANFSYGAFGVAGICGIMLYFRKRDRVLRFYEDGGRMAFHIAFIALLGLPIVGFFYAWILKYHASTAYKNLMWGAGDVVAGGIDWWWVKHIIVASMLGMGLFYHWRIGKDRKDFTLPAALVYAVAGFYLIYYLSMGQMMTWTFSFAMVGVGLAAALLGRHLISFHKGSAKAVFITVGILSFLTVLLGGYAREASRPRFLSAHRDPKTGERISLGDAYDRYWHADEIYLPPERQTAEGPMTMVDWPTYKVPVRPDVIQVAREPWELSTADLISRRCSNPACHTLEPLRTYPLDNWGEVVRRMRAQGADLTAQEAKDIIEHLKASKPY